VATGFRPGGLNLPAVPLNGSGIILPAPFEAEPPSVDHVLLSMDNCLFSPHIASFGSRTVASMTDLLIEQINAVASGRTPPGLVNAPLDPRFPEITMRRNVP